MKDFVEVVVGAIGDVQIALHQNSGIDKLRQYFDNAWVHIHQTRKYRITTFNCGFLRGKPMRLFRLAFRDGLVLTRLFAGDGSMAATSQAS